MHHGRADDSKIFGRGTVSAASAVDVADAIAR